MKSQEKGKKIREYIKDNYNSKDIFSPTEKEFLEFAFGLMYSNEGIVSKTLALIY